MNEPARIDRLLEELAGLKARVEELEQAQRARDEGAAPGSPSRSGFRRPGRGMLGRHWLAACAGLIAAPMVAWAVELPFTFVNGTLADASQVNANFGALEQALEDHVADTTIHHPPLTSINGLAGGTITGDVVVTGKINVPIVEGTPLRLTSPTTVEVVAGSTARMLSASQIQIQSGLVRIN